MTGINSAWIPFTLKSLKKEQYRNIMEKTNIIVIFVAIMCLAVVIIAPEAIMILGTEEYYDAKWVVPPVILGVFFCFISSLFANVEFYKKKTFFVTIATTFAGIINIVLNVILIPKYGFIAAGYTTLVGYICLALIHYCFMIKIEKEKVYDIKTILIISLMLSLLIGIETALYSLFIIRYILLLLVFILLVINFRKIKEFFQKIKEI